MNFTASESSTSLLLRNWPSIANVKLGTELELASVRAEGKVTRSHPLQNTMAQDVEEPQTHM